MTLKQEYENGLCEHIADLAEAEVQNAIEHKRLRSCKAWVLESDNYYFLKSYNTIVAIIPKCNGICYDLLRKVYGYTATSSQHIAKFVKDYGKGTVYRWR